jgi:hypothetical protein
MSQKLVIFEDMDRFVYFEEQFISRNTLYRLNQKRQEILSFAMSFINFLHKQKKRILDVFSLKGEEEKDKKRKRERKLFRCWIPSAK